jgi:3-oxoacyl-[acyl-carrier protein] reductase
MPVPVNEQGNRVAVVTGGGTGIGKAIAAGLAQDGFEVVIVGRRPEVLAAAAEALNVNGGPGPVSWRAADLADPRAVQELADGLRADHGSIDALVNNAGSASRATPADLSDLADLWRGMFDQNVLTAVLLTQALLPALPRPGGRIVLIGSMTSRTGGGAAAYGAAKAALNGWVLALSNDHAAEGISANVVLPGYVPGTELGGGGPMPPELHDRIVSRIAAGRPGLPEDTAALVRFLVSEPAGFLTGQVIEVNGGTLPANR